MLLRALWPLSSNFLSARVLPVSAPPLQVVAQYCRANGSANKLMQTWQRLLFSKFTQAVTVCTMGLGWECLQHINTPVLMQQAQFFMPALLFMTGKRKTSGKSKRIPKPANHGARPCSHVARRSRRPPGHRYKPRAKG